MTGICVVALVAIRGASAARAANTGDFYRGKTVTILVGGAAYDFVGRALARHLGAHISGNPRVVVENMPGAASLRM